MLHQQRRKQHQHNLMRLIIPQFQTQITIQQQVQQEQHQQIIIQQIKKLITIKFY